MRLEEASPRNEVRFAPHMVLICSSDGDCFEMKSEAREFRTFVLMDCHVLFPSTIENDRRFCAPSLRPAPFKPLLFSPSCWATGCATHDMLRASQTKTVEHSVWRGLRRVMLKDGRLFERETYGSGLC